MFDCATQSHVYTLGDVLKQDIMHLVEDILHVLGVHTADLQALPAILS